MTFDDGIMTVYSAEDQAALGAMPVPKLTPKDQYYYGYDQIGITRYYTALQANQQVDAVINIPGWNDIKNTDIVILQEQPEIQYQIHLVQPTLDENGIRITKLTLERISQIYEVPSINTRCP